MGDRIHDLAEQADVAPGALGVRTRRRRLWGAVIAGTCLVALTMAVAAAVILRPGAGVVGSVPVGVSSDPDPYFSGELPDSGGATGVAISPDGEIIAAGMGDDFGPTAGPNVGACSAFVPAPRCDSVQLWDARTGKTLRTLLGESKVVGIAFSPDGKLLATGSDIFDVATGERLTHFAGASSAYDVAFSPDGHTVATAIGTDPDGVKVYDSSTGALSMTLTTAHAFSVAFSPDGSSLAFSINLYPNSQSQLPGVPDEIGWIGTVLWRVGTDEKVISLENEVYPIFSPDGSLLATTVEHGIGGVRLRNPVTGEVVRDQPGFDCLGFSADGRIFVSAFGDQLQVVDPKTGAVLRTVEGVDSQNGVVSPDGRRVVDLQPVPGGTGFNVRVASLT